ncbi:MAG: hypothetical protein K2X47_00630, partial [Bdellovibrionales bacterium]|nr:hypothetical protein [Bdellovibrionales bacterium]
MTFHRFIVTVLLSLGSLFSVRAGADTVYVAFGDSITAGAWASTALPDSPLPPPLGQIGGDQGNFWFFERKSTLSWATGSMIRSFAARLRHSKILQAGGGEFHVLNVARSGVSSDDLKRQFDVFRQKVLGLGKKIGLKQKQDVQLIATLLIGANNICD